MAAQEDARNRPNNFEISSEEASKLSIALKEEKFRGLLIEYAKELSDPKNREIYESEIAEYERERGSDVEFIEPRGNYVIKTWNIAGGKVMINICTTSKVDGSKCQPYDQIKGGQDCSIPYIIGSSRQEIDRKKNVCDVIDVLFNDSTLQLAQNKPAFRTLVHNTALDAAETYLNYKLNRQLLKFPKLKYKGVVQKCMLRIMEKRTPEYDIVFRENSLGVKTALIIKINLPMLLSTANCCLDVTDTILRLNHDKYNLEVTLPIKVNSDKGKATFDGAAKKLVVELPTYENSQELISIPLACHAINNKIQEVQNNQSKLNLIINDCQAMTLDNTSDETADSSDSENNKNLSQKENLNFKGEKNINETEKIENESEDITEDNQLLNIISRNGGELKNNNRTILLNNFKEERQELDNFQMGNNYWDQNNANTNATSNHNKAKLKHLDDIKKRRSFSESSDDYSLSHSPCKGILKGFSMSGEMSQSLEHSVFEEQESEEGMPCCSTRLVGSASSVKKSVSFSEVVSKQYFRPDSSILGQRKKNQRRARNKRKNSKQQNSESEDVCSESEVAPGDTASGSGTTQTSTVVAAQPTEFSSDLMFDIDM